MSLTSCFYGGQGVSNTAFLLGIRLPRGQYVETVGNTDIVTNGTGVGTCKGHLQ